MAQPQKKEEKVFRGEGYIHSFLVDPNLSIQEKHDLINDEMAEWDYFNYVAIKKNDEAKRKVLREEGR